jgi:hypothetical protein
MAETVGTFNDIVALEPKHGIILRALRALAYELHPGLIEVTRTGDRAVSWGWGPKKMSESYACALPYSDHVNVAFYRGAFLSDPDGILKGTGKAMRHATITHISQVSDGPLRNLLIDACEERRQALGLSLSP